MQQEIECLTGVLRAVQAYRDSPSAEALMKTLQSKVIEQRQRYDKLVHTRTSKVRHVATTLLSSKPRQRKVMLSQERELEAVINELKALREESAVRIPDKASQRRLRLATNNIAKARMKLQEAQSIEQMYRALLLQLRNDREVARKDLADIETACDKADREMVQLQQQLKQRRAEHATALDQYSMLVSSLQAAKHQAHASILQMQRDILGCHEKQQSSKQKPCTLEGVKADVEAGELYLASMLRQGHSVRPASLCQDTFSPERSTEHVAGQQCRPNSLPGTQPRSQNNGDLSTSSLAVVSAKTCSSGVLEAGTSTLILDMDKVILDEPRRGPKTSMHGTCEDMDKSIADPCIDPAADMPCGPSGPSHNADVGEIAELSLIQADYASTRAVSCSGSDDSREHHRAYDKHTNHSSSAGSNSPACGFRDDHMDMVKKETNASEVGPVRGGQEDTRLTEEDLVEAWGVVERCIPGVRRLGHHCGTQEEVMQTVAVISEAQKEMVAVLQQWVDSGKAELARRQEGALNVVAD